MKKHLLIPLLFSLTCAAQAATITVDSAADGSVSGKCTLRDAVKSVNNNSAMAGCISSGSGAIDTIEFDSLLAGKTIGVQTTPGEIEIISDLIINAPAGGITLDANLSGSGPGSNRIFYVSGGSSLSITGVRFINGNAGTGGSGGAIWVEDSLSSYTLTLEDCAFEGNRAYNRGGAVRANTATIHNSTFESNTTIGGGGAVYATIATISNSTFESNRGSGGAVYATTVTISESTFVGNNGRGSGGAVVASATATISNSTFVDNIATHFSGAVNAKTAIIHNSTFEGNSIGSDGGAGGAVGATTAIISNSTFEGNSANSYGGAVDATTATISNSIFENNEARSNGGAVYVTTATISDSTFEDNEAGTNGGAVYATTATISDSTFEDNKANSGGAVYASTTATISNSTFKKNAATYGGAVYASSLNARHLTLLHNRATAGSATGQALHVSGSSATLHNSIIISYDTGQTRCYGGGAFANSHYNLEGWVDADLGIWQPSTNTCGSSITSMPPTGKTLNTIIATILADNGGPTKTLKLPTGSPAIGAADPTTGGTSEMWDSSAQTWTDATLDQRGYGRAVNPGNRSIGAYEHKSLGITTTALADGTTGQSYSQLVVANTSPSPNLQWSATGLPSGLSIDSNSGEISGSPTAPGDYQVTVKAEDTATNQQTTRSYTLRILLGISGTMPNGTVGVAYSGSVSSLGATSFSITGTLPDGLSFDVTTGAVSGMPAQAGSWNFTITASDSSVPPNTASMAFSVLIQPFVLSPASSGTPIPALPAPLLVLTGLLTAVAGLRLRRKAGLPQG